MLSTSDLAKRLELTTVALRRVLRSTPDYARWHRPLRFGFTRGRDAALHVPSKTPTSMAAGTADRPQKRIEICRNV